MATASNRNPVSVKISDFKVRAGEFISQLMWEMDYPNDKQLPHKFEWAVQQIFRIRTPKLLRQHAQKCSDLGLFHLIPNRPYHERGNMLPSPEIPESEMLIELFLKRRLEIKKPASAEKTKKKPASGAHSVKGIECDVDAIYDHIPIALDLAALENVAVVLNYAGFVKKSGPIENCGVEPFSKAPLSRDLADRINKRRRDLIARDPGYCIFTFQ